MSVGVHTLTILMGFQHQWILCWNSELFSFISTLVRQHYSKTNSQNEDGYIDIAKKQGEPTNHTYKTTCLFTDFHKVNCKFASGSMDSTNIKQKNN